MAEAKKLCHSAIWQKNRELAPPIIKLGGASSLFFWVKLSLLLSQNVFLEAKPEIFEIVQKLNQVLFGPGYDLDR